MDRFEAGDIEYKGLTGSGFETPWMSDEKMCGTKGMSVPLVGFAVRLKPGPKTGAYDCEYSGFFKSGITIGPLRNGARAAPRWRMIRWKAAGDHSKAPQARQAGRPGKGLKPRAASAAQPGPAGQGPSFGRYRKSMATPPASRTRRRGLPEARARTRRGTLKPAIPENHTADDDAASRTRPVDRRS